MSHRTSVHTLSILLTLTIPGSSMAMELPGRSELGYSKELLFEKLEEFANLDPETCNPRDVGKSYYAYHGPLLNILHVKSERKKWQLSREDKQRFESLSEQMNARRHEHRKKEDDLNKFERGLIRFGFGTMAIAGIGVLTLGAYDVIPTPHLENEYLNAYAKAGTTVLAASVATVATGAASMVTTWQKGKEAGARDTRAIRLLIANYQTQFHVTLKSLWLHARLKNICNFHPPTLDDENVGKLIRQHETCQKLIAKMQARDDECRQLMFYEIQPLEALQKKIVPNFREEDVRRYPLIQTILDSSKATAEQLEKLFTSIKDLKESW